MRNKPKTANKDKAFSKFENLTKKLVNVPKKEVEKREKEYKKKKEDKTVKA